MADPVPAPVDYDTTDPLAYRWTELAYDLLEQGRLTASITVKAGIETARVDGVCPRCQDPIHYLEVRTAVTEGSEGVLGTERIDADAVEPRYSSIDVTCACTENHPGHPQGTTGCGISFKVETLVTQAD